MDEQPNQHVPSLTLHVGGVDFSLEPRADDKGLIQYQKKADEILLNLSSFTGTLRVNVVHTTSTPQAGSSPIVNKITPKALVQHRKDTRADAYNEAPVINASTASPQKKRVVIESESSSKRPKRSTEIQVSAAKKNPPLTSQASTLLGQPDLSQTQSSTSPDAGLSTDPEPTQQNSTSSLGEVEASRVKEIMKETATLTPVPDDGDEDEEDQNSVRSSPSFLVQNDDSDNEDVAANRSDCTKSASISIASPPSVVAPKVDCPCPRWGHTFTPIGTNKLLVYGGQTVDPTTKRPETLGDLFIYNTSTKAWMRPFSCEGLPRQWHTSTFLPDRQLLISFGGEALIKGRTRTTDQVMVLDTEIMLWYPPAVSGDIPSGRSGHTATLLPKSKELVVFGGVKGSKWLNTVSVLDTTTWRWSMPKLQGSAPKPRSYHSATVLPNGRIVVFGGNNAVSSFNTVHVLDTATWSWSHPFITGYGPAARTGHSATLLSDLKTICIYGGWDPNSDDEASDDDHIFQDCFYLNTDDWTWTKGPDSRSRRVGHEAVLLESEILVFGGRVPGDTFVGNFEHASLV